MAATNAPLLGEVAPRGASRRMQLAAGLATLLLTGSLLLVVASNEVSAAPEASTSQLAAQAPVHHYVHHYGPAIVSAAMVVGLVCVYLVLTYFLKEHSDNDNIVKAHEFNHMRKDPAQIDELVQKRLGLESYADLSCFALLMNRPWKSKPGPKVEGLPMTPNKEWCEQLPFPNGAKMGGDRDSHEIWPVVFAFWTFLWRKKTPYLCVFLMVVEGICAPVLAQLTGQMIGEMAPGGSKQKLGLYCFLAFAVNLLNSRAEFVYEVEVPGASVRYELTFRLQRQFLGMQGELAKAWPAGRCSAVLNYDIIQAVNLCWESVFAIVKCTTSLVMLTGLLFYNVNGVVVSACCFVIFLVLIIGTYFSGRMRRANCIDLAVRKRNWECAWTDFATEQVVESRNGNCADPDRASKALGDMAMVFRKRAFHYYFVRLVAALGPAELTFFSLILVTYVAGQEVIFGNMSVGDAAALIGVVKLLAAQLSQWVTIQLNIYEGYASVLEIATVFNADVQ